jgi:hypothetical protein
MRGVKLAVLLGLLASAPDRSVAAQSPPSRKPGDKVALAVILHAKNPVVELSLAELRAYFRMEKQFWPNKRRAVLYLRPSESLEYEILLDKVYRMTHEKLQQFWVRQLFSGEIPAKPSYVPTAEAAGSRVRAGEGAVSVVLFDEVPRGVRVLKVDGKGPGEEGYPLTGVVKPPEPEDAP